MELTHQVAASRTARAFIEKAKATASGWAVSPINSSDMLGEFAFLYCFDFTTGFTWMGCVSFESFLRVSSDIADAPAAWPSVVHVLDRGMTAAIEDAGSNLQEPGSAAAESGILNTPENAMGLAEMLGNFAGISRDDFGPNAFDGPFHFVAVRYTPSNAPAVLRALLIKAVASQPHEVLSMDQLHKHIVSLVAQDKASDPEWFA